MPSGYFITCHCYGSTVFYLGLLIIPKIWDLCSGLFMPLSVTQALGSSIFCQNFYLWALWDCSKWELELNRNNMLQAIMDIIIEFPGYRSLILIQTLSVSVNSFSCFNMTFHFQSFQSKLNFRNT